MRNLYLFTSVSIYFLSKTKKTFVVSLLSIALSISGRRGEESNRKVTACGICSLLLALRSVSTENLLDVIATMVVVHFRFGQATVSVRFVRLEVFNVGKTVV